VAHCWPFRRKNPVGQVYKCNAELESAWFRFQPFILK
jgi:hypothetical protein